MTATCLRSSSVLMSRYLRKILKVEYVLRRLDSWTVIERCSELWCFIGFPLLRSEDHEWRLRGDSCKEQSSCSGPQHSLYRLIGHLGNSKTSDQEIEHWLEGIFVPYRYCHQITPWSCKYPSFLFCDSTLRTYSLSVVLLMLVPKKIVSACFQASL